MLKDNLTELRKLHGYSQEELADKIGISRQAYAKWENGATVPDIEKCASLAEVYGVTLDSLVTPQVVEGVGPVPPAPKGKSIWGSVTINERGQLVIPKPARERYGLTGGQRLIVLGDEQGIALVPAAVFEQHIHAMLALASLDAEDK